jgi:predicted AAA+ superfamily ATPase
MSYQRPIIQILIKRLKEPRKFIQVAMGPRQVGKTTLVSQLLKQTKQAHYFVSADGVANSDIIWIIQHWETAKQKWMQSGAKDFIFVIDEIQKIDNWSEAIKKLWDEDTREGRPIKVILLGSSRLLLQ